MNLISKRRQIFISHSHHDAEKAKAVAAYLRERGFVCWLDQAQLRVGQLYDNRISEAIRASSVLLILVSRASAASDYVKYEATLAVAQRIPIAPVFIEAVPKEELKTPLDFTEMRLHALNFSQGDLLGHLPRLVQELEALLQDRQRRQFITAGGIGAALVLVLAVVAWLWHVQNQRREAEKRLTDTQRYLPAAVRVLADTQSSPPRVRHPVGTGTAELQFQVSGMLPGEIQWRPLQDGDTLASGEAFYIRAQPRSGGYLYVFQQDSSGKIEWLFPANETSTNSSGTNPIQIGERVMLPANDEMAYTLDENTGLEHFFAVLCPTNSQALESALKNSGSGSEVVPLPEEGVQLVYARSKGIAGTVPVASVVNETRHAKGQSLPAIVQPVAFRSTNDWVFVHQFLRHVASRTK